MVINRVCISGNLTRDPELRSTGGGTQVLSFGVAVNDRRKSQQTGQWEDVPNYVDCVVFGARAEPLSRFLFKGSKVAVEGRLRYSSWETKEGQRRSKLDVVADEVELMQRPRQAAQQPHAAVPAHAAPARQPYQPPLGQPQAPAAADPYDADIPF
jgi:single-strand DNA-binding protein